jgi:GxxExxY protein
MQDLDCDERTRLNQLTDKIIGAAVRVHREIGPGLLESAYEACLTFELLDIGLIVQRQLPVPMAYRGRQLDCGYRIDLFVADEVIVEVKAIERLDKVHAAQLLSQMRLKNVKVGLVINFNVRWLQDGIKRVVNGFPE